MKYTHQNTPHQVNMFKELRVLFNLFALNWMTESHWLTLAYLKIQN